MTRRRVLALSAALTAAPAASQNVIGARPGLCYWAEGRVSLNGRPIDEDGLQLDYLKPGEEQRTNRGRAEVLLGPNTVLRAGGITRFELVDADPERVAVRLHGGSIILDVNDRYHRETITVLFGDNRARMTKLGVYRFDFRAGREPVVRVFQGEANVKTGGKTHTLGKAEWLRCGELERGAFDVKRGDWFDKWSQKRRAALANARDAGLPPEKKRRLIKRPRVVLP